MAYERLSTPFTQIPNFALDDKNLTAGEFRLYVHLIRKTSKFGYCSTSNYELMDELQVSPATLQKQLSNLKEREYIFIDVQHGNQRRIKVNLNILENTQPPKALLEQKAIEATEETDELDYPPF